MNSMQSMQRRFLERGEVEIRRGIRRVLVMIFVSSLGALIAFAGAFVFKWTLENGVQDLWEVGQLVFGGVIFLIGVGCVVAHPLAPIAPYTRRLGRIRITREGIDTAGVLVPWYAVESAKTLISAGASFVEEVHIVLVPKHVAPQVVWSDGSKCGQWQADYSNERRELTLWHAELNVRPKTLAKFLMWARRECTGPLPHERSDLNFEQL